jgi:hypothetical protein
MRRKKEVKEKFEQIIGRIVLVIIQSLILVALFLSCAWCVGRFINLIENNSIVRISTIIIAIILAFREMIQSAKGE